MIFGRFIAKKRYRKTTCAQLRFLGRKVAICIFFKLRSSFMSTMYSRRNLAHLPPELSWVQKAFGPCSQLFLLPGDWHSWTLNLWEEIIPQVTLFSFIWRASSIPWASSTPFILSSERKFSQVEGICTRLLLLFVIMLLKEINYSNLLRHWFKMTELHVLKIPVFKTKFTGASLFSSTWLYIVMQ